MCRSCLCADLCQPLREAGRLSLGEGQEEGLLPERPESWSISKSKDFATFSLTGKKNKP